MTTSNDDRYRPRNKLKELLTRNEVSACMMVRMFRGTEIARAAAAAGFDALYVDLEHSALSLGETGQICMTAQDLGVTPLVRVPDAKPEFIGQVLDCGAMGVIVPGVETAEQARAVVSASKFAPLGKRSIASGLPQLNYANIPLAKGSRLINETSMVALMIETQEALDNIDAIAGVDGVDLLHLGLNDLTANLQIDSPWDHAVIRDIVGTVLSAARRHGRSVGVGGAAGNAPLLSALLSDGVRFVSAGTDLSFLLAGATERVRAIHNPPTQDMP